MEYRNDKITTSKGQSGSSIFLIKYEASSLEELKAELQKNDFKLNFKNVHLVGIHDGNVDGMTNVAARIDRAMLFEFILPCIYNLLVSKWPKEK